MEVLAREIRQEKEMSYPHQKERSNLFMSADDMIL